MIRFQKIGESDGRKIRRKERKNYLQNELRKNWEERLKNCKNCKNMRKSKLKVRNETRKTLIKHGRDTIGMDHECIS